MAQYLGGKEHDKENEQKDPQGGRCLRKDRPGGRGGGV